MSSVAMCVSISVSEGAHVLKDGNILRVSGNRKLHEVLQEVGLVDRVDDVHSVQTATTDTSSKQDVELDDEVQLHAEFKRRYVLRHRSETECTSSLTSERFQNFLPNSR